jgi:hypothetical protein
MRLELIGERDRHPTEGVSAMYSVVMVVAMTGAPEVPQCDFFCFKPKVCCTTTKVACAPQPVTCCPKPTCAPRGCGLLKCFSFCGFGHSHNTMAAPAHGCGTVVIPPTSGAVTPDVKKEMPKPAADPKKLGPAPAKIG